MCVCTSDYFRTTLDDLHAGLGEQCLAEEVV